MAYLKILPALALVLSVPIAYSSKPFQTKLTKDQQAVHAIERLTFGARPGDLEHVKKVGVEKWIEEQLHPENLPEDPALAPKLADLKSLQMPAHELFKAYPPQQVIAQIARGNLAMPDDPLLRHAVQMQVARLNVKKTEGKQAAQAPQGQGINDEMQDERAPMEQAREKVLKVLTPAQARTLRDGTPDQKRALLLSLPVDKVDQLVMALSPAQRRALAAVSTTPLRRKLILVNAPQQVIAFDLNESKLQRAVYSTHQLEELMVDFWYNHFNVYLDKGPDRHLVPSYERDAIRPYALGKFKDMLKATAQHPAMLFYLDNWQSVGPLPERRAARQMKARPSRGLNENYARELLELHTLGVDGGYTQKDVTEVARCLTGWTIVDPRRTALFTYNDRVHDKGEKSVLGVTIPAGGNKSDGEKVLEIVLHHPSTARFIARKLAVRFVADEPPPDLVDRMAKTFHDTDGDIRAVLRTMFLSKEFMSTDAYRAKVKSPFEMVVSAVRALHADVEFAGPMAQQIAQLGQPLYRKVEPTGYSSANSDWVNSAALLGRMNFALSLAQGKLAGVKANVPEAPQAELERLLLPDGVSASTRQSLAKALENQEARTGPDGPPISLELGNPSSSGSVVRASSSKTKADLIAGLLLGSPEFQRR